MQQLDDRLKELYAQMGLKGQRFVGNKLEKKFPKLDYLIVDMHDLMELDYGIYDLRNNRFKELHEVKTTTRNNFDEFNAGSILQLKCFNLQDYKRRNKLSYVPFYLDIVVISKEIFRNGNFNVLEHRVYDMDRLRTVYPNGNEKAKWKIIN